eukprot:TRINITY_DN8790_c0_g1_i2.p1 TRINITY_DN8790_c0_g1~~TRINITY_DN8790_c0_g1_i2.p1  ORF type:complete len:275 (+),score=40.67 TRINITY_DN8790_c0_g1_i2:99-827(+)
MASFLLLILGNIAPMPPAAATPPAAAAPPAAATLPAVAADPAAATPPAVAADPAAVEAVTIATLSAPDSDAVADMRLGSEAAVDKEASDMRVGTEAEPAEARVSEMRLGTEAADGRAEVAWEMRLGIDATALAALAEADPTAEEPSETEIIIPTGSETWERVVMPDIKVEAPVGMELAVLILMAELAALAAVPALAPNGASPVAATTTADRTSAVNEISKRSLIQRKNIKNVSNQTWLVVCR